MHIRRRTTHQTDVGINQRDVIDLITRRPGGGINLVMIEQRDWSSSRSRLRELECKLHTYLTYIENGDADRDYPEDAGREKRIAIHIFSAPDRVGQEFLAEIGSRSLDHGVPFSVVRQDEDSSPQ